MGRSSWCVDNPVQLDLSEFRDRLIARRHHYDVLILDTAGRLGIDEAMMREIRALHDLVRPVETLFVVDAMQGQDAVNTARAFADALPQIGRAHVCTPVTNAHLVCRLLLEKKKKIPLQKIIRIQIQTTTKA